MSIRINAGLFAAAIAFAALASAQQPTSKTTASSMPAGWLAHDMQPLGYLRLPGTRAFKLTMKHSGDRWYLYVAQTGAGFTVADVTDPQHPRMLKFIAVPDSSGQITRHGDLLILGQQGVRFNEKSSSYDVPFEGVPSAQHAMATLYDVSNPADPKRLSSWVTEGWATHRNVYPGGKYAYMAAWVPGYRGQATMRILDVSNPLAPKDIGGWWQPGQADNEPARPSPNGFHGPANLSADGRMLTVGYTPSLVNLDITDILHPKLIGKLDFAPLPDRGAQAIHTALSLANGYVHVNTEPNSTGCDQESMSFAAMVDNRDPSKPRLVAYYPRPLPPPGVKFTTFCDRAGRFGPHNVNGETHLEELPVPTSVIYMTYFNAGLRVFDIRHPDTPREVAWFLPAEVPFTSYTGERGPEDVLVDSRDVVYASDGATGGVWILRHKVSHK